MEKGVSTGLLIILNDLYLNFNYSKNRFDEILRVLFKEAAE